MPSKTSEQDLFQLAHSGFLTKLSGYIQKTGKKLNVNGLSRDGATALIQCVQGARVDPTAPGADHVACCQLLLRCGAKPNLADRLGRTALHWAVFYKKTEFVRVLLESKADVSVEDKKGQNVIQFAVRMNAVECLKLLCESDPVSSNGKILAKPSTSVGTPLIYATKLGHKECCEILLRAGANIDIKDQMYFDKTCLHVATELDHADIVEMLIKYNADLKAEDAKGNTILHMSCVHGNPRCTEVILDACKKGTKELVERRNKAGLTALMVASQQGHEKVVKLLLDHNSPTSVQDQAGKTALHYATEKGHTTCVELLLARDPGLPWTQDSEGRSPLHLAVIEGKKEVVVQMLKHGSVNCQDGQGHTPLHWAVVCGFHDLIDLLVDHGGDPSLVDDHGAQPLHYAAQMCGDPNVSGIGILCLKALIKRGAKVNAIDVGHKTPLLWAASAGSSEACRLLKEAGANTNMADLDGLTALHCAVTCNHSGCVATIIKECECKVDVPDKNGCTPLYYAAAMDQADNVELLLESGASPNYADTNGKSPVHCAVESASLDVLKLLREHNGSLESTGPLGHSPFHEAILREDLDILKFLIASGCKPDSKDEKGRTPLHVAAENAKVTSCRFLVDLKVDLDAIYHHENGLMLTPLDCAWDSGAVACMDFLASVGAQRRRDLDGTDKQADNSPRTPRDELTESAKNMDDNASQKSDGSRMGKGRPYAVAPHPSYDHAQQRNEDEKQQADERKSLRSMSIDKKLGDWEGYVKDHVQFLDDLLSVDHERLESIKSHAMQEKENLVKRLEDIRKEMEQRMEKKSSEAEKLREERRKQQLEDKKAFEERWKKIQEQYLQIGNKASHQMTVHKQATEAIDKKSAKMEKRFRKQKSDLSSRRSTSRSSTVNDDERTQRHVDWLKRKNKEYLEKKNAVKLQGVIKIDSVTLSANAKRSSSPKRQRSPVASKVDHSHHTRRSPSPPSHCTPPPPRAAHPSHQQTSEKQPRHSRQPSQWDQPRMGVHPKRTPIDRGDALHGNPAPSSSLSSPKPSQSGISPSKSKSRGGRLSADSGRTSSQSNASSHSLTSHQLAQMRRNHGDSLNRKLWPKSWELHDNFANQEEEEIYDLKRHFSPRWDGKLRHRHILQFTTSASGSGRRQRPETEAEA
ncbi:uncharacterized protein [Diadema antillarum]|uniref:uncharacterized protein n=1 Tax=Diadema antillarum TaxID=105358 RepID=UPI003A8B6F75